MNAWVKMENEMTFFGENVFSHARKDNICQANQLRYDSFSQKQQSTSGHVHSGFAGMFSSL